VYRFIAEDFVRNYPRWSPEVKELRLLSQGPLQVGTQARQVRVDQGRRTESTFRVTCMQPPANDPPAGAMNGHGQLRFEGNSPASFVVDYRLEPDADHTRLVFTFEIPRLDLMLRPFEKLIRIAVQDGAGRTVRNLKSLVESDSPPAPARDQA
jgi:hypothetical protein